MNPLAFVSATLDDVDSVARMVQANYAESGYPFDEDRVRTTLRLFVTEENLGWLWLLRKEDRTVGYLAVTLGFSIEYFGRDAFVDEVYVAPDHRGEGLGRRAVEFALERCKEARVKAVHLEVERNNRPALELYRRLGFADHDRLLMTRRLT